MKPPNSSKDAVFVVVVFLAVIAICAFMFQCDGIIAQDKPSISLRDFSGGLNTNTNPFLLKENEFLQLHNFDITDQFGSISLRRGFKAVTDSFPRPIGLDSINITLYVINRVPGPLPPLWPLGEEFLVCSLQSADYALNVGGLWDNIAIKIKNDLGNPDTATVIANFNPTFTGEGSAKFTGITVYDSTKFDIGDSLYAAQDTGVAFIDTGKVTGLYAYIDRSGRKFLASITPGFASGGRWSALMVSQQSKYQASVRLWPYIYRDETPIWETWKSHMFIALPRQRPLVFDGTRAVPLIPRAPGQLEIIPVTTLNTTWKINGLVRYTLLEILTNGNVVYANDSVLKADSVSHTAVRVGYVSHEIELDDEHALIFGFPKQAPDSFHVGREDSVKYYVCRTRGRPFAGEQPFDSLFVIDSIIADTSNNFIDTLVLIDSVPDDSLGSPTYPFIGSPRGIIPFDTAFVDSVTRRNDSAFFVDSTFIAPGGPTFISRDTANNASDAWWKGSKDKQDSTDVIGVVYFTTLLDTLNGAISDSSPNLWVALAKPLQGTSSDSTKGIKLGIPTLTARDSGLIRILWRSRVLLSRVTELSYQVDDTVYYYLFSHRDEPTAEAIGRGLTDEEISRSFAFANYYEVVRGKVLAPRRVRRGVPFAAYLITSPSQDTITDTLQWVELLGAGATFTAPLGGSNWSPLDNRVSIFNGFYAFNDILFGWAGSRLYRSALDTAFIFRPFQDVAFNLDDGDEITQVAALGPNLLVFKNRSITELYDPIAGLPTKGSQNNGIGCIAPHSLVEGNGVIMFLSEFGVVSLKASQFQPFGIQTGIISHKINNLILGKPGNKRSAADMKKAVGALVDDKYLLSFPVNTDPSNDTTFVYHIPLDAWTTYDFSFHQTTKYDTFTVEGLVQSNRLLFVRPDDERVFEFNGSPFYADSGDANAFIPGVIETHPLFTDPNYWAIREISLLRSSGSGFGVLHILNQNGVSVTNETISLTTSLMIDKTAYKPHDFIWTTIRYNTGSIFADSLIINGIDIWGRKLARQITR